MLIIIMYFYILNIVFPPPFESLWLGRASFVKAKNTNETAKMCVFSENASLCFPLWWTGYFKRNLAFVSLLGSIFGFNLKVRVCNFFLLFTEKTNSNKGSAANKALSYQSVLVKQQS